MALFGDNRVFGFNHRSGYAEKLDQGSEAYHDVKRSKEVKDRVMCVTAIKDEAQKGYFTTPGSVRAVSCWR